MLASMPRRPIHVIAGTDDWAVMMAPVRFEIVEAMRGLAPCSVGEIAQAQGALVGALRALRQASAEAE